MDTTETAMVHPMGNASELVEQELTDRLKGLGQHQGSNVLAFIGDLRFGVDAAIRDGVEAIETKLPRLSVVLRTPGGYIEVVQRIVDVLRKHYEHVDFFIPDYAYSAGTVLVMSGDRIFMDYFAVLGPIDPQVERRDTHELVPALGYVRQYERLVEKSSNGGLSPAELAFLVQKFDPAQLFAFEQQRELGITLLKDWLVTYKFKDWKITRSRKKKVSQQMKTRRAGEVAKTLGDPARWHSHGRGISMDVLRKDLKLEIDDFSLDKTMHTLLKKYYSLLTEYLAVMAYGGAVHTDSAYIPLG